MPNVVVIAGPNGAGKTTLAPMLLGTLPEETVHLRFERGQKNLFELYLPIADAWQIYNAGTEPATETARYDGVDGEVIIDSELWKQIKK